MNICHQLLAAYAILLCFLTLTSLLPHYNQVRIGFGLHVGWAIEGALGSDKKIDATYISPHVNMAELLESSTKEYEVPLLMSEPFYRKLSPEAQKFCRQVNRVQLSLSEEPMGLYTYDCDVNQDFSSLEQTGGSHVEPFTLTPSIEQSILRRKAHKRICKQVISSPQNRKTKTLFERKAKSLIQESVKRDSLKVVLPKRISLDTNKKRPSSFLNLKGLGVYEQLDEQCGTPKTPSPRQREKSIEFLHVVRPSVSIVEHPKRRSTTRSTYSTAVVPTTGISAAELQRKASRPQTFGSFIQQAQFSDFNSKIVIPKYTKSVWLTDSDLKKLRMHVSDSFRSEWSLAFDLFIKGSWKEALSVFHELQQSDPGLVVPAKKILNIMEESGGVAPKDWPGWCRLYSHGVPV